MWSDGYLADIKIRDLTWEAKGIFTEILCILRTQTDDPGYLKINGDLVPPKGLLSILLGYQSRRHKGAKVLLRGIDEILKAGLLQTTKEGLMFSPRIVQEVEESKLKAKVGKLGGYQGGKQRGHQPGHPEVEEKKIKNTEQEAGYQSEGSENIHKCTATHIHQAKELNEKWIKTFSEDPSTSHNRFIDFTKKYSQASINQALEVTQEKHINSGLTQPLKFFEAVCKNFQKDEHTPETKESSQKKHVSHLTNRLCKELGLKPTPDLNPYYNQLRSIVATTPQKQVIAAVQLTYQTENKTPTLFANEDDFIKFFTQKVSEAEET